MAITMTQRAASKIRNIFEKNEMSTKAYLRVGVKGGGCSGFNYTLDVTDKPADDDEIFTSHDVQIVCDPKSYLYLNGTEVDYEDHLMQGGFKFNNPNATKSCGCGASFSA
jgi:iron-sulfur cluster assembly protein